MIKEEFLIKKHAYPDHWFRKVTDIKAEDLRRMGAKAVALDLDNTTVNDASFHMPHRVRSWVRSMQRNGFKVIIVSNTISMRAWFLSKKLGGVPFVANARKPRTDGLRRAARKLHLKPSEIAMIGDQLFTDVLVANRVGAISVKVDPVGKDVFTPKRFERIRKREQEYLRGCPDMGV